MPLRRVNINGHLYDLEVGPGVFDYTWEKDSKSLALFWVRPTQFKNIVWMRVLSIGWRWPLIRSVAAFTDMDEPAPQQS